MTGPDYRPVVTLNGCSLPWRMNGDWKEFHLVAGPVAAVRTVSLDSLVGEGLIDPAQPIVVKLDVEAALSTHHRRSYRSGPIGETFVRLIHYPVRPVNEGVIHDIHPLRRNDCDIAIVMFGLMYLNTYALDHVWFSQTRMWMAFVMGAVMAVIMLAFMMKMYPNKRANVAIAVGSVVIFGAALWLVRSQQTVDDVSYMKAMIPHHSIAIMTSERAHIRDPRVRKLADGIIEAQVREIAEMEQLIGDLSRNPPQSGAPDLPARKPK